MSQITRHLPLVPVRTHLPSFKSHINSTAIGNYNILHELCWKYYEKPVKNSKNPARSIIMIVMRKL